MASQLLWRDHIAWSDGQTSNGLHCWLGTHIRSRAYCPHAHSDKSSRRQLNEIGQNHPHDHEPIL
jgi:hypothetical protein